MNRYPTQFVCARKWRVLLVLTLLTRAAFSEEFLPHTAPLNSEEDLSAQMVAGIQKFLERETARSVSVRTQFWHRDFSSLEAYQASVATNRQQLKTITGLVDPRVPLSSLDYVDSTTSPSLIAETEAFSVHAVRWAVFENVWGEGLWLRPKGTPVARIIDVPDADQTPEMLVGLAPGLAPERQSARRLAENGCEVIVPVLVNRQDTWSANPVLKRFTNQPHREWIYRQAFELGRHLIGYEVQKILAAIDFFAAEIQPGGGRPVQIGVVGYGEGGLLALYSAAMDPRISATLVSGYFGSRQALSEEPIYRNVFGLLEQFGDAEIATLVAPRALIIEHSRGPAIDGPPPPTPGRSGAAPGKLTTPDYEVVEVELERARALLGAGTNLGLDHFKMISGAEGMLTGPIADRAMSTLLNDLGVAGENFKASGAIPTDRRPGFDPAERQHRQISELEKFTQSLLGRSERTREAFFWNQIPVGSPQEWKAACAPFKQTLWENVIGRFPAATIPINARSRRLPNPRAGSVPSHSWTGYEVLLDVYPDVFAWGYLLLPHDLKPGERRPVVVCQHGLEGLPADVINIDPQAAPFAYYKGFAARLADQGFVVFAPHNPYRGGDRFRHLQRLANPLGKSLFSIILAQHERILEWLSQQEFVDANRIGFYGLSYGGKTAMRVPALLDGYALSICSADFNDWVRKNASVDFPLSYMFMNEYELPEFNLGATFNYAEMAALIAPRPFMVERGHEDGVGIDEWVASEYAKVRRLYDRLGIPDRTAIEFFNGPHTIHGVGTFEFLHRELNWSVTNK